MRQSLLCLCFMMRMGMNYNRRAYISVPLTKYVDEENPHQTIRIKFKYHTTDKNGVVVESSKYCDPGFEYVPGVN